MKVRRKSFHFQGNQNAMLSEGIRVQDCEDREVNASATISTTYSCIFARWTISIYQWQDGTVPLATVYPHFTWKLWCPLILLIGSVFSHKTPNYLHLPNRKHCEALGSISDLKFPASHTNLRMELLASRFLHFKEMASVFFFQIEFSGQKADKRSIFFWKGFICISESRKFSLAFLNLKALKRRKIDFLLLFSAQN